LTGQGRFDYLFHLYKSQNILTKDPKFIKGAGKGNYSKFSQRYMSESTFYVYPGQPFIGEAIIHLLLAFNNEPNSDGSCSINEREHSQISYALIMIALESIIKVKLNEKDLVEPAKIKDLFEQTIEKFSREHGSFELWNELKILRNLIVHSAYFGSSKKGGYISKATKKKLESPYSSPYLDLDEECTKNWKLTVNPLNISRYEAFVCLMFFYWYGKETGVWQNNGPLNAPYVDCRMWYNIDWINKNEYQHLVGQGKDFSYLIGYMSGRLSKKHRTILVGLAKEALGIDLDYFLKFAKDMLDMFRGLNPG
jgi:hypothetical protein